MARKNLLVKLSGNLIDHPDAFDRIRELSGEYAVVICTGGGEQINEAFNARGFETRFGPFGRVTSSFEERQVARDVLEKNQMDVQDLLAAHKVPVAGVIIPVLNEEIGTVICHVNGDLYPILAYNGYDRIEVWTLESRREKKEQFYHGLWDFFARAGNGIDSTVPNKIVVIGFTDP